MNIYPYKISWSTKSLKESHEYDSYGYVKNLIEIKNIIYKYVDEYIHEHENRIKDEIEDYDNTIPIINRFFEMVNSEPYNDSIFLSIRYFDCATKSWHNYDINETELNEYLLSYFE